MSTSQCRILLQSIFCVLILTLAAACSKDELEEPKQPTDPKAEVSFIVNNDDGGSSDLSAPTVVETGDTLNMTISQKSSYTDTDGKVYSCEPKATISLHARLDTLYAKDLSTLTRVKQTPNPTTSSSGTNPVLHKIEQTFDVGGQEIAFDLGYEIYRYTTAGNSMIEMPYIKLNPAKLGVAEAASEGAPGTRTPVAVTAIKLTPIAMTRGGEIRDSTMYNVSVSFNLDMESMNTESDSKVPLSFEVEYVGVIENITTLPDATTGFSYQLNILGGTTSQASPFTVTKGEELSLAWVQSTNYTYFSVEELSGKTVNLNPKATVNLSVAQDTINLSSLDGFENIEEALPVEETSGENPIKHLTKQSFNIGSQTISLNWSYEALTDVDVAGETITLPYLQLEKAEVVDVSSTEIQNTNFSNESDKMYEVTVRFRQRLTGINTPDNISQNIEYIVKYVAVFENKLISTTYEKDYKWYEAHDNLPPTTYYVLRRIRTYSTGEHIIDTFTNPIGWSVEYGLSLDIHGINDTRIYSEYRYNDSILFVYHARSLDQQSDYCSKLFHKTGVSNLKQVSWENGTDFDGWDVRDLREYSYIGNSSLQYNPSNPVEGWYIVGVTRKHSVTLTYGVPEPSTWILGYEIWINFYDRFLYLDGQVFDFSEYRMTYDFDFREESTTLSDGTPAKVFTHDLKAKYLERDFYVAIVDTVYQLPK